VTLTTDRVSSRPRRPVTLRYSTTRGASVEVRVLRVRRRVARVRRRSRAGRNRIRIRAPRRAGRYRLELVAITRGGQRATDRGRLTIRRARRR